MKKEKDCKGLTEPVSIKWEWIIYQEKTVFSFCLMYAKYLNPIKFCAIYFRAFNFRAFKQFMYSRTHNFRALTKFILSRRSKLWLKLFSKTLREICRNTDFLWSVFSRIWTESYLYFSVFGQNGRFLSVFSRIWTESEILSKYGKIRIQFCPHRGKYGSEKAHISAYFTQWEKELDAN